MSEGRKEKRSGLQAPSIRETMGRWVKKDIDLCIGCNRCMEACPVSKEKFTIGQLNHATEEGTRVPARIKTFAFNCVQCGRCVPVCPAGARRDYMVLFLRHKLKAEKPRAYTKYLAMKGPFVSGMGKGKQKIYATTRKLANRDLASFMETTPSKRTDVLFYPGCYVYNTNVVRRTLKLLRHVGVPHEVLGGLNSCCGVPQLLQGEFELADRCLDALHERVMKSSPKVVITACAECLEALLRIKLKFREDFEVLTVVEYLLRHIDRFPEIRLREKVTLHDSCRVTRRYRRGGAARQAIARFAKLEEMENSGSETMCCYYWNQGHDPANETHRLQRLEEAKTQAKTMVCDCISCYERYIKPDAGVEVIELLQLFEEALDSSLTKAGGGGA